jgi:hypothetical protein
MKFLQKFSSIPVNGIYSVSILIKQSLQTRDALEKKFSLAKITYS